MNEEICPDSIILRSTQFSPTKCFCPIYSFKDLGLSRSANGSNVIFQGHLFANPEFAETIAASRFVNAKVVNLCGLKKYGLG